MALPLFSQLRRPLTMQVSAPVLVAAGLLGLGIFAWIPLSYYRMVAWPGVLVWQGAFLVLLGSTIWQLRQFSAPWRRLGGVADGLGAVTVLGMVGTSLSAPNHGVALWYLAGVLAYCLLLYAVFNSLGQGHFTRRNLWRGLGAIAIVSGLISLSFWRPSPDMWQAGNFNAAIRNAQTLGHHNFVGGYFALSLPLVVALVRVERGIGRRLALAGAAIVLVALYVSGSRGAALGFVVWVAVSTLSWMLRHSGKRLYQGLGLGALLLAVGALVSNPRVRSLLQGLATGGFGDITQLAQADGPLVDRIFMAQAGINLWRDHPLLGGGLGNTSRLFNLYRPIEMGTGLDHVQQLHNTPIHLLAELGLVGIGLYLGWILWASWIGLQLWRRLPAGPDQALLFGLGGAGLAYGVSSLTDFQLENIPIALTLSLGLVLLVDLARDAGIGAGPPLPRFGRRVGSLVVLAAIALLLRVWLPFDAALALTQGAVQDLKVPDLVAAQAKWLQAGDITPWDPTPMALAGQNLLEVEPILTEGAADPEAEADPEETDVESIRQGILETFKGAYQAAPYDAYFNSNLAVRLLSVDSAEAETFATRAVQLLPRTYNYLYYLLSLTYLAQDKETEAVTALTLEALERPEFLALPMWVDLNNPRFVDAVVEQSLVLYDALLADVSPTLPVYQQTYEQAQLLRWWWQRPLLPPVTDLELRPFLQALLQVETDPAGALAILNGAIANTPNDMGLQMLRAWLEPDNYLEELLTSEFLDSDEERAELETHIRDNRTLRSWLRSLTTVQPSRQRNGLAFAYRNRYANNIDLILRSDQSLLEYTLVEQLGLLGEWPREFPELDRLMEAIKAAELGLVHPTRNGYQLPEPTLDF